MSKTIKAMFDSTDMAEFAMMRVKRSGIVIEAYKVEPTAQSVESGSLKQIVFPYNTDYGFGAGVQNPEFERIQPFGGVLYTAENNNEPKRGTIEDDIYPSDVSMSIKVSDNQADITIGILRSCHALSLRIL